jgi:hypothetical protein
VVCTDQTALAGFHAKGFEAAAITQIVVLSMPRFSDRLLQLRFSRPFAFLAR